MPLMFDFVSRWCLITLCILLPFFFIPVSWVTVPESKAFLLAALLGLSSLFWAVAAYVKGELRLPVSLVLAAGVLLPIVYTISAGVSGWSPVSLVGNGVQQDTLIASMLCFAALVLFALAFSRSRTETVAPIRALFVGVGILAALQILHFIIPALPLSAALAGQTGNAFGNWHELGIALGAFLFLALALRSTPFAEGNWRYLFDAVALVSLALLVIADFFDVWAALAVLAAVMIIVRVVSSRRMFPRSASVLLSFVPWLVLGIVALTCMFFGSTITGALPASMRVATFEVRPSWQGTLQVGEQALTKPSALFFGQGPNTFTREWSLYKPAGVNQTQFWNTDFESGVGSIPTSFITLGIIGILAWVLFIAACLWMTGSALMRPRPDPLADSYVVLLFACLYLLAFHVLYVPGASLNALTFMIIGLSIALAAGTARVRVYSVTLGTGLYGGARLVAVVVCALLIAGSSVVAGRVLAAEVLIDRAVAVYKDSQNIGLSSSLAATALRMYPSDDKAQRAAVEIGLLQLQQMMAESDPTSDEARAKLQAALQDTIQHGLVAVSIDSGDYQNWLELASIYQNLAGAKVAGAYDYAKSAYDKAQAANPTSPLPFIGRAQLEILQNEPDLALKDLSSAIQMKPDLAMAYYLSSQVYAGKGDFKNAIPAALQAARYAPDDPQAWYNAGAVAYAGADYTDAAAAEEQALTRVPQYANALYILGLSYYALNRPSDALSTFEALDKLAPGQQPLAQIIANLKAGKAPLPQKK